MEKLPDETRKKHRTIALKVLVLRKMSGFHMHFRSAVNLLLILFSGVITAYGQPVNDACNQATELCPGISVQASNQASTATVCPNCEDDFTFCFTGTHSIWFSFTTNASGGDVAVDFSNLLFVIEPNRGNQLQASIYSATIPCNGATYTALGNCEIGATGNFTLTATGLPANTTYYIVVNGATNGGATLPAEASFDIVINGTGIDRIPAIAGLAGPPPPICPKQVSGFTVSLANCTDTSAFTWKLNGQVVAVTEEPFWETSELQTGDIVTVECSCFTVCPQQLTSQSGPFVVEDLFVDAGPDQVIASGGSTMLSGTTNGTSFSWSPASTLGSPTSLQTIAIPPVTTTYFLTASSANCTLSDDVVITVGGEFVIPGSFSPNGDGINDTWVITGLDNYPNAKVQVFNRWGQEIISVVGYGGPKTWDGTNNGEPVTDGTYFYTIDLVDGKDKKPMTGYVTVLR